MTYTTVDLHDVDPGWPINGRWRLGAAPGEPGGMALPVDTIYVHHTVSSNAIRWDQSIAGPCDTDQARFGKVSYSWMLQPRVRILCKAEGVHRGAHTINNAQQSLNGVSFGLAVIGNYQPADAGYTGDVVTDELVSDLADAILTEMIAPGYAIPAPRVLGHRDVFATACCGDLLYDRLDDVRALVRDGGDHRPQPQPEDIDVFRLLRFTGNPDPKDDKTVYCVGALGWRVVTSGPDEAALRRLRLVVDEPNTPDGVLVLTVAERDAYLAADGAKRNR